MSLHDSSNPFVGLRPFESDESLLFFGRQEQTLELLQRLHQHHFVAVVGSSGSGKSSLIRAGLIPSLKGGYLVDDRDRWMITIMKPGQSPLYNLADAILNQLKPGTEMSCVKDFLKKIKEEGSDAVLNVIQNLWKEKNTNFFLLVDQFEELFRFSMEQKEVAKKDDATDFVNIMLELSRQTDLPIYVVITMRSDFIGDCARFYGLPEAMNQSQYLVPRLNRVQFKSAIEGPVKLYSGKINAALTSKLLNDSGTVKDELPLLQHALMRIWDHEINLDKNGELDLKDYESIGGIEKALCNHADEALKGMSDEELNLTKKIFQALTTIDENGRKIRRPVRLKELQEITGAGKEQLFAIINRFIEDKRSFLVINKAGEEDDYVIDISHESLIRQWSTLSGWVDEETEASKNYLRLVESSNLYRDKKKDLMAGSELQLALQWCKEFKPVPVWAQRYNKGFEDSILYLRESEKEWEITERKKKTGKRNQLLLILGSVVIAFIFLGMFLKAREDEKDADRNKVQVLIADRLRKEAEKQEGIAQDSAEAAKNQRSLAEEKTKEADSLRQKAESQAINLAEQNLKLDSTLTFLHLRGLPFYKDLDTATANAAVNFLFPLLFKKQSDTIEYHKVIESINTALEAEKNVVSDPNVALWISKQAWGENKNPITGTIVKRTLNKCVFYSQKIESPSTSLLTISNDKTRFAFSDLNYIKSGKYQGDSLIIDDSLNIEIRIIALSYSGSNIIGLDELGNLFEWNNGRKEGITKIPGGNYYTSAKISPDGSLLLAWSNNDSLQLWNISDLEKKIGFPKIISTTNQAEISQLEFSPNNKNVLLLKYYSDSLQLWDVRNKSSKVIKLEERTVSANFSPDGDSIITISQDGDATIVDATGKNSRQIFSDNPRFYNITSLILTRDWKRALIKDYNGNIALCENVDGGPIFFSKESNRNAQGIKLNFKTLGLDPYQRNEGITKSYFLENDAIIGVDRGYIYLWKDYPNFKNIDEAFAAIKVPDLSFEEKFRTGLLNIKEVLADKSQDHLYNAALFYFKNSSGEDSAKMTEYFNQLYEELPVENQLKIFRELSDFVIFRIYGKNEKVKLLKKDILLGEKLLLQPRNTNDILNDLSNDYGELAYNQLFIRDFKGAIQSVLKGIKRDSKSTWIYTNLTLGYLLNNQFKEAESIYIKYKDSTYVIPNKSTGKKVTFKDGFLGDFETLEAAGIISKNQKELYEEVEKIKAFLNKP